MLVATTDAFVASPTTAIIRRKSIRKLIDPFFKNLARLQGRQRKGQNKNQVEDRILHSQRRFAILDDNTSDDGAGGGGKVTENSKEHDDGDDRIKDPDFLRRNKYWVVLVDDEESIRIAVGDYLYDQGYQVTACADVDALFEACRAGPPDATSTSYSDESTSVTTTATATIAAKAVTLPDAVVSDIRMPGKDGMQLLTMLRESDSRWERVPVILLTAKAMTQDRIAGYKAGADYFLPKPFHPDELLSMIDNAILRRQQMAGANGQLLHLKDDLVNVKEILRQNGSAVVKRTTVYLTPAERHVLDLLCQGYSNGEIASQRGVSVIGVNRMIQKLYSSTQTRTRTELVRWAITTGYVSPR